MTMKFWKTLKMGGGNRTGTDFKPVSAARIHANHSDIYELEDIKRSTSDSPDSGLPGDRFARRVIIHLDRRRGKDLGLILAGRSEPGLLPTIAGFKKDSAAHEADRFAPGDRISSINGIATARLTNDEVISLLDNVEERASLEVEYYLPNYESQSSLCVTTRIAQVPVERQAGSLGVTLRSGGADVGGCSGSNNISGSSTSAAAASNCRGPLTVTHVRPGGPAHATARIKPGDRIIKADNISLANKTLAEAHQILQNTPAVTNLTIEYDISIMESVKFATGPLLIEIERACNESLGILLTDKSYNEECFGDGNSYQGEGNAGIYIESIIPATIADRCGALHHGDQLLAIDDLIVDSSSYTPEEVMCYMDNCSGKGFTQLQILPVHMLLKNYRVSKARGPGSPISGMSTLNSRKSHRQNRQLRQSSLPKSFEMDPDYLHNNFVTGVGVCRTEVLSLQLDIPPSHDSGLTVCEDRDLLLISHISHQFPAYRCGCFQLGDRILSINSQQNLTAVAANNILQNVNDTSNLKHLYITTEFSMADSVEASSGVFNVKLAKNGAGLGVTITGNKQRGTSSEEPMIISHIKVGSVAYRSGTLAVGDKLIAIDSQPLHNLTLDAAFDILQNSPDDIITLTVRKTDKKNDWSDIGMRNGNISYGLNEQSPSLNSSTKSGNAYSHTLPMKSQQNQFACIKREPTQERSNQMETNDRETVFELELVKHNDGPLGLTIAGSEDASTPIVLSGLIKGGLAERSEELQIGDRILSINGESVNQKPLSDAIKMLQSSSHRVLLKISRKPSNAASSKMTTPVNIEKVEPYGSRDSNTYTNNSQSSPGLASIDSAVESWDSQPTVSNVARDNTTGQDEASQQSQSSQFKATNDNRISYLPTDENKLLASGYRISDARSCDMNELQMPNYSFTNTLRTFKTENPMSNPKTKFNDRFNLNNQNFEGLNNFEIPANSNNHKTNYCDDNADFFNKFDSKEGSCQSSETSGHKQYNLNPPELKSASFMKAHDNSSDGGSSRGNNIYHNILDNNMHGRSNDAHNFNTLNMGNYQIPTTSYQLNSNHSYDSDIPGFYNMEAIANQGTIHHVTLYKDVIYDDYGFSVSDGLYERGVYINRIRKGGPADIVGLLKPFDRILQVNGTRTVDFDCCLTVPLIASAGDRIELILQRLKDHNSWGEDNNSNIMDTGSIITKTI